MAAHHEARIFSREEGMNIFDLTGEVAIVTGGNQGIGLAISKGLAQAGATVVIADIVGDKALKVAESLKGEGLKASAIQVDVTKLPSLTSLVSKVMAEYGKIDVLVNSAGVILRKQAEEVLEEEWDFVMGVNLKGLFFCCQQVGKEMIKKRKGKIINISSDVSQIARGGISTYSISKAGVSQLTRALAVEWGKYNVHVNAIAPGTTLTEMTRSFLEKNPDVLEERKKANPMGRLAEPSDHVGVVIFLASSASDFVNGQTYHVDGGATIW
jgi:NAD(P)-dependent dehydrogenase (short-subunit alcohol dehydrogenase family)